MKIKKVIILKSFCLLLVLTACARHEKQMGQENKEFYQRAEQAKISLKGADYKNWIKREAQRINDELLSIEGQRDRSGRVLDHQESATGGSANVSGPQDVHGFQADRTRQHLMRLEERKSLLRRHLFYLNSQLSQLEGGK